LRRNARARLRPSNGGRHFLYYAFSLEHVYERTWGQTLGLGAILTMLYALTFLANGLLLTAAMLSV